MGVGLPFAVGAKAAKPSAAISCKPATVYEGMDGISTRFAFKVLSSTFNFDTREVAADPVHLMYVLEQAIWREQFPDDAEKKYLNFIKAELAPRYAEFIGHEIQKAYLESYSDYGQNLFDRYVATPMPGLRIPTTRTRTTLAWPPSRPEVIHRIDLGQHSSARPRGRAVAQGPICGHRCNHWLMTPRSGHEP